VHFKLTLKTILLMTTFLACGMISYAQETNFSMEKRAAKMAQNSKKIQSSESFKNLQNRMNDFQQQAVHSALSKATGTLVPNMTPFPSYSSPKRMLLFIFISTSIPEKSILHYLEQAQKTGALVVLQGLIEESLPQTLKTVSLWKKESSLDNIILDPVAFERFNITQVPSIVLTQADYPCPQGADCNITSMDKMTGEISLDYALRKFSQSGDLQHEATRLLTLLGASYHEK
jgi:type-F conjugative transfer system pilin assembly protein TrbC